MLKCLIDFIQSKLRPDSTTVEIYADYIKFSALSIVKVNDKKNLYILFAQMFRKVTT